MVVDFSFSLSSASVFFFRNNFSAFFFFCLAFILLPDIAERYNKNRENISKVIYKVIKHNDFKPNIKLTEGRAVS
ncbi:MAG: hypothetical protein GY756_14810 [bacterium]|nr:hypothetical protein [bacterium]